MEIQEAKRDIHSMLSNHRTREAIATVLERLEDLEQFVRSIRPSSIATLQLNDMYRLIGFSDGKMELREWNYEREEYEVVGYGSDALDAWEVWKEIGWSVIRCNQCYLRLERNMPLKELIEIWNCRKSTTKTA